MKQLMDMSVCEKLALSNETYALLKLRPINGSLPLDIMPGQFVQIEVADSKTTFLRRPISINFVDYARNEVWLLVRNAGEGTRHIINAQLGQTFNIMLPLGKGFSMPKKGARVALVGGGVGVAPLLYFGKILKDNGFSPEFVLGARSKKDLLLLEEFGKYGAVHVSTEDGSMGEKGFVTQNTVFNNDISHIACCGPTPMMKAVGKIAKQRNIYCEVSLENMMACGVGACLCCVEDTDEGNLCVCKEGPVFNIEKLKWEI